MNEAGKALGDAFLEAIRQAVREEFQALVGQNGQQAGDRLLDAEELADRLKVPVSWVYEQSRQGNIPTHRLGRYIRFNLHEVLASQQTKN